MTASGDPINCRVPLYCRHMFSIQDNIIAGPGPGGQLNRCRRARRHFNLELHGIDALDDTDVDAPGLARVQPGLRLPAAVKLRRLEALLGRLRAQAESCTLEEAASRLFA